VRSRSLTVAGLDADEDSFELRSHLERLDELRKRLVLSVSSLFLAFFACFSFSESLYRFLMAPMKAALPEGALLVATRVPEIFLLHLRMAFFAALFLAAPVWLYQIWRFIRRILPLKRAFLPLVLLASALFVAGAAFGHFVLFPLAVRFLTTVGAPSTRILLSVGDLFSFYSQFLLGLGLAFQIPTVVLVLSLLSLVTPRFLLGQWRIVLLGVFALAALLTPTPDLVTQCLLALPMLGLYFVSIALCWMVTRKLP
jgi:sec-independent protein translocase protein TatC